MILEAVKTAGDMGVDADVLNEAGDTALHMAVSRELNSVVQFPADRGARLDIKNKKQQTPLALATVRKAAKTIELLHKSGAKE